MDAAYASYFLSGIILLLTTVFCDEDNSRRSLPLLVGQGPNGLIQEDKKRQTPAVSFQSWSAVRSNVWQEATQLVD